MDEKESDSENEASDASAGQTPAAPVRRDDDAGADEDEGDEEEWNERSAEVTAEASGGEESDDGRRKGKKKDKAAGRRGGRTKTPGDTLPRSGKKKRAPRWTKEVSLQVYAYCLIITVTFFYLNGGRYFTQLSLARGD